MTKHQRRRATRTPAPSPLTAFAVRVVQALTDIDSMVVAATKLVVSAAAFASAMTVLSAVFLHRH